MTKNLVLVFTRNPELGKVKTRLAKSIGDQAALNIYKFLLEHTEKVVRSVNCDKAIFYTETISINDIWDNDLYQKYKQIDGDLGDKMEAAFARSFKDGYNKVVIVGSDLFDLEPMHIEQAFQSLDTHDYVLGPAQDGGYYLLGMNQLNPNLFKNKSWGTATVFEATMDDLKNETVFLLEELNDVDTFDDIKHNNVLKSFILQND